MLVHAWKFKSNTYRRNVTPEGWKFVHGEIFGMSTSRIRICYIAVNSRNANSIDKAILRWLSATYPDVMNQHHFTTMVINSNYSAKLHRDANNAGISMVIAIGNYTGGNLMYWKDYNKKIPMHELVNYDPQVIDVRENQSSLTDTGHMQLSHLKEQDTQLFYSARHSTWTCHLKK